MRATSAATSAASADPSTEPSGLAPSTEPSTEPPSVEAPSGEPSTLPSMAGFVPAPQSQADEVRMTRAAMPRRRPLLRVLRIPHPLRVET